MCDAVVVLVVAATCVAVTTAAGILPSDKHISIKLDRELGIKSRENQREIPTRGPNLASQEDEMPSNEVVLRRLLRDAGAQSPKNTSSVLGEQMAWRCLMSWVRARSERSRALVYQEHRNQQNQEQDSQSQKSRGQDSHTLEHQSPEHQDHPGCDKNQSRPTQTHDPELDECAPLLLVVIPSLCNGTQGCLNLTQAPLEEILHRYWVWQRRKQRAENADEAVVYIVVVLAFYSFGIVFMMANFVRQEQRELDETKMYKQYVKLARDRWLTTKGNPANKLALQALNTFNAIPQTTDVNKVTFV